jgi:hypothetical protein
VTAAHLIFQVISHETCHLLGIQHCVYFHCAMNESDSLELALSEPLQCCPFCMIKIKFVLDFRLDSYFANLNRVCEQIHEQFPSNFWCEANDYFSRIMKHFKELESSVLWSFILNSDSGNNVEILCATTNNSLWRSEMLFYNMQSRICTETVIIPSKMTKCLDLAYWETSIFILELLPEVHSA